MKMHKNTLRKPLPQNRRIRSELCHAMLRITAIGREGETNLAFRLTLVLGTGPQK